MAPPIAHLIPVPDPRRGRPRRARRSLAVAAILALLVGSLAPAPAIAAEAESEGQGQGTAPPGMQAPEFEPGGAETVLEGTPEGEPEAGTGEAEEAMPVEAEPAEEAEPEEGAPATAEAAPAEAEGEAPSTTTAPGTATPEYAPAGPEYETPAPATAQPVENEALVEPKASGQAGHRRNAGRQGRASPAPEPPAEEQPPVAPTRQAPASLPAAVATAEGGRAGSGGSLAGHASYTVAAGDCLWSIAARALPPGTDDARIAAEVARLWHLNAGRIGTGDPDLILVGTVLRLA